MSEGPYVVFVGFLLPTDWEKRATVSDAAVTWAGQRNLKRNEETKRKEVGNKR